MMPARNRPEALDACVRELAALGVHGLDAAIDGMQWVWDSYMDDEIWEDGS